MANYKLSIFNNAFQTIGCETTLLKELNDIKAEKSGKKAPAKELSNTHKAPPVKKKPKKVRER